MGRSVSSNDDVRMFIQLDLVGATLGLIVVLVVNGLFVREPGVWLTAPPLIVLMVALVAAQRVLGAGHLHAALLSITAGNWIVALSITLVLPFLWPVMVLTAMMPLVLGSPHLKRKQVMPALLATAAAAATIAALGLLNDDGGAIDDIDDALELVIVIGGLSAQVLPIGLVIWQQNQNHRTTLATLQDLNANLRLSEAELAASRERVVNAADTERRRIERDLHDGAQQRLVAMGVRLRLLQSQEHKDAAVRNGIDTLVDELDGTITEVRELAHGIYPPLLQTRGLPDAISAVIRRSAIPVESDVQAIERLPEALETALYFTALEALTNAAKHADPATIKLSLTEQMGQLELQVTDDGRGFDVAGQAGAHGFNNMSDRLAVVGGKLDIASTCGVGTTITATALRPA